MTLPVSFFVQTDGYSNFFEMKAIHDISTTYYDQTVLHVS